MCACSRSIPVASLGGSLGSPLIGCRGRPTRDVSNDTTLYLTEIPLSGKIGLDCPGFDRPSRRPSARGHSHQRTGVVGPARPEGEGFRWRDPSAGHGTQPQTQRSQVQILPPLQVKLQVRVPFSLRGGRASVVVVNGWSTWHAARRRRTGPDSGVRWTRSRRQLGPAGCVCRE